MSAETSSFMPSQLLNADLFGLTLSNEEIPTCSAGDTITESLAPAKSKSTILDLFNKVPARNDKSLEIIGKPSQPKKQEISRKDMSAWFQLFSDLDPLANPDTMANKIGGGNNNSQAA